VPCPVLDLGDGRGTEAFPARGCRHGETPLTGEKIDYEVNTVYLNNRLSRL